MEAVMMITALAWPLIGGALAGLIGGIVMRHGVLGTLIDVVLGAAAGFGLTLGIFELGIGRFASHQVTQALTLGLPVAGGLLVLWLRRSFRAS